MTSRAAQYCLVGRRLESPALEHIPLNELTLIIVGSMKGSTFLTFDPFVYEQAPLSSSPFAVVWFGHNARTTELGFYGLSETVVGITS